MTTLRDREPGTEPRNERVARIIREQRERHERKGHTWSSVAGYCSEPNGVTAVFCDDGLYLEALEQAATEARRELLAKVEDELTASDPNGDYYAAMERALHFFEEQPKVNPPARPGTDPLTGKFHGKQRQDPLTGKWHDV